MTFKEDFKPTKVYNKLVNDVCYNADCLEEFEKQRLVVANPFSYNKSTRTGIIANLIMVIILVKKLVLNVILLLLV